MRHKYTKVQRAFILENVEGISNKKLTELFNKKFNLNLKVSQLKGYKGNHKLDSGLTGRFKKGCVPWNKDLKGVVTGGKSTQFRKGNIPKNTLKVGTETLREDGYLYVKMAEPNEWKQKHHIVWEEVNKPIPKNHVILFGDGDRTNFDINNLILISRKQLLQLNRHDLIQDNADLTRTGIIIADLEQKISEVKKEKRGLYVK